MTAVRTPSAAAATTSDSSDGRDRVVGRVLVEELPGRRASVLPHTARGDEGCAGAPQGTEDGADRRLLGGPHALVLCGRGVDDRVAARCCTGQAVGVVQ